MSSDSKLIYQHYGYKIQELIRSHESVEHQISLKNGRLVIDNSSDEEDYKTHYENGGPIEIVDILHDQLGPPSRVSNQNNVHNHGFNNFEKVPPSFWSREENVRKVDSAWLLKNVLLAMKYRLSKMEPMVKKKFNNSKNEQLLRFIEFGKKTSKKEITALMSDPRHQICCIFPRKHYLKFIAKGNLDIDNPYTIFNFMFVKQSHLKFVDHKFMKNHFNFKVDPHLRYCILELIDYEYVRSVKSATLKEIKGVEPITTRIDEDGNEVEIESEEEFDRNVGFGSDSEVNFDEQRLRLIYNNELYRRLCLSN
ncbi:uncharacterized protein KGF55_005333 [Candida pseudojiufengensis]|uniref:uncharacterized protein n=1 Tax=Candida pseudojiufengensis TaxID=497109 RepID=UPI0022255072|nr:uncharacterized protein KGF55_005333 [Candida pseudojiufengensis]KAI5959505.1 hypothetical protein KGF55_005333 [Candida pseudojiufengensis]